MRRTIPLTAIYSNNGLIKSLIDNKTTLFWFRRDLRLEDNGGLFHALKQSDSVLPLFIFDQNILSRLEDKNDARVTFIHDSLARLKAELEAVGSTLLVLHGKPQEIFRDLEPCAVYTNHDYEPYGRERDATVSALLRARGIPFHSHKDIVIFEKEEVTKSDRSPYTVFTPYSRKWKEVLQERAPVEWKTSAFFSRFKRCHATTLPTLEAFGFTRSAVVIPERKIRQAVIRDYAERRDFPGLHGTSRLGIHLRFGTVSIRRLVKIAQGGSGVWLNELIWREFYHMILWHFPHVVKDSFKPAYDRIIWRNDPVEFQKWCDGQTGYPLVDAGMRELNTTGYMHNRVRMVAASFLTKHLLIDWRWGEAYFARKLLDFELASNNGGWQWAAGTGCDAAPYFRVFNPMTQAEKFDRDTTYVKRWVPEEGSSAYPAPIVDHATARDRALKHYRSALT